MLDPTAERYRAEEIGRLYDEGAASISLPTLCRERGGLS